MKRLKDRVKELERALDAQYVDMWNMFSAIMDKLNVKSTWRKSHYELVNKDETKKDNT